MDGLLRMPVPDTPPNVVPALSTWMVQALAQEKPSPAQQRFNDLLAQIERLSGQIQRLQTWSDQHRHAHLQAVRQSSQQAQVQRKALLFFVHERLQVGQLTAPQQRMARAALRRLIAALSGTADPQVQALAEVYENAADDLEAAQEQAEAAQRLRERIEEALGQPLHKPRQYPTPDEMMAAGRRQWQQQQEADEARKAAKRAARKAQKKSAAMAAGRCALPDTLQADAQSAMRTVYRQLASALHPDREPDLDERQRKTGWMSEVNAAYEKKDWTTLLRLQMQVLQAKPASSARLADHQLMAMCSLLKEQAAALAGELDQLQRRLRQELCVPVSADVSEAQMSQALQRLQADQRHTTDSLAADLRRIQNETEFKRWLKAQWHQAKEQVWPSPDL